MKDNLIVLFLVIIIGILSSIGLLFGVGNVVQVAIGPLMEKTAVIASTQQSIERKLDAMAVKLGDLEKRGTFQAQNQPPLFQQPQNLPQPNVQQGPPGEDFNKVYSIPIGNSPIMGKPDAPITIVQFTDLQCPFCNRFYPPIKEVLKAYPDKVRFIIKNFPLPFHPNARPAAKYSMAAREQGKYIEMVELLLTNGGDVSDGKIKEYAKQLGLNEQKLRDDVKNKDAQYEAQIKTDMDLAGQVDVQGTPTFYLNGKKTISRDFNSFKTEIDAILNGK